MDILEALTEFSTAVAMEGGKVLTIIFEDRTYDSAMLSILKMRAYASPIVENPEEFTFNSYNGTITIKRQNPYGTL